METNKQQILEELINQGERLAQETLKRADDLLTKTVHLRYQVKKIKTELSEQLVNGQSKHTIS